MASFRDTRETQRQPETAIPIGMRTTIYFKEPIGGLTKVTGQITYCSTYGIRLGDDGLTIFVPHANVIGGMGDAR